MNLKTKSILLVAACFLVILSCSYFLMQMFSNNITNGLASNYAKEQLNYNRAKVMYPLMRELALAQLLADSHAIKKWAAAEDDPQARSAALQNLEEYRKFFSDRSVFFAIKKSGHYYYKDKRTPTQEATHRYTLNPDSLEDQWFYRTISEGRDYALNVDYDEKLQVTKVWINVVVKGNNGPLGIIGTGIDLTEFIAAVVTSEYAGVSSLFVEQSGAIQAASRTELIDFRTISKAPGERKTIYQLLDPKAAAQLSSAIAQLDAGTNKVELLRASIADSNYLIAVGKIADIGWYNLTLLDTSSFIGARQMVLFTILLLVALLLLSLAFVAMLNRFVFQRIYRLDRMTHELAEGGELTFPEGLPHDEIGRLEYNFQQMASSLREHSSQLEQKVEERTRELEKKNEQLSAALAEIKVLSGLLPICMYCKEIRNDKGAWTRLENYIEEHSNAEFSHGICDKCMEERFGTKNPK